MKDLFNKKNMINFDKKLMNNIVKKPEKVAWNRLSKQKNINLFGDKDKDKLMNIFDCDPLNTKKQATYHKVLNLMKGKGYKEDIDTVNIEGPRTRDLQTGKYIVRPNDPISNKQWIAQSPVGQGFKNIYQASGIPQKLEERKQTKDLQQEIKNQAYQDSIEALSQLNKDEIALKTQQQYLAERDKQLQALTGGQRNEPTFRQEAGRQIRGMGQGLMQATQQIRGGVSAANPTTWGYRVDDLIGMRGNGGVRMSVQPTTGEGFFNAIGVKPVIPPQQPMMQPQQPMQQSIQPGMAPEPQPSMGPGPQPQGVISPYSKRKVNYTRGPYRKKIQYQPQ